MLAAPRSALADRGQPATSGEAGGLADVTAVVVTHGVTAYLSRTLAGLAAQTRAPAQVLMVDVGPDPATSTLLDETFSEHPQVRTARTAATVQTLGAAIDAGLAKLRAAGLTPGSWIWVLHDDSAPEPTALHELVRAAGRAPSVAVAGAKQRTWTDPERLVEAGVTTTPWGRRVTGVGDDDLDQGQLDGRSDVLAVGLAGAIVRTDVWTDLAGTDPTLGRFGDGLDLCRRARLAGHRVIVVPQAVVRHARASYLGLRSDPGAAPDPGRSWWARRRSHVHARLVDAPSAAVPLLWLGLLVASLVRAAGAVVSGRGARAGAEITAAWAALADPAAVLAARSRSRRTVPRRVLRPLRATWKDTWALDIDRWRSAAAGPDRPRPGPVELAQLRAAVRRRRWTLAGVLTVATAMTFVAHAALLPGLLSGGRLVGPALDRLPTSWAQTWSAAGWQTPPLGGHGPGDPWATVLAVLAVPWGGDASHAVAVLLLGAVPLSAWAGWAASGAATRSLLLRAWAAGVWAFSPSLMVALRTGRVSAVVAHVLLGWAVLALARSLGVQRLEAPDPAVASDVASQGRDIRRHAPSSALVAAALSLAALWAAAPSLVVPTAVLVLLVGLGARAGIRSVGVLLPGLVLVAPTLVAVLSGATSPWTLLVDPGPAFVDVPAPAWERLLGSAAPATATTGWATASGAAVLAVALASLLVSGRAVTGIRVGWLVGLVGTSTGVLLAMLGVVRGATLDGPASLGPATGLAQAGFLVAALLGADEVLDRLRGRGLGWRHGAVAVAGSAALLVVVTGATTWAWGTRPDPGLRVVVGPVVPAVTENAFAAGQHVLQIGAGDPVRYDLLDADGLDQLDETAASAVSRPDAADIAVADAVAQLVHGSDVPVPLGDLAVAYVQVPAVAQDAPDAAARAALVAVLDSTPGLERVTDGDHGAVWRVSSEQITSWARLQGDDSPTEPVPGDGRRIDTVVDAAPGGRTLVLASRWDESWQAELDGVRLSPVKVGWRQGFAVPADQGGRLVAVRPVPTVWWYVQGAAVLLVATMAVARPRKSR